MRDALYSRRLSYSTLGLLSRRSDVIGVGIVSNREDDRFTVTVDHALAGCTGDAASPRVYAAPCAAIG